MPDDLLHRTDAEDLATLGEMLHLGAQFIDDQDDPTDPPGAAAKMTEALAIIGDLVPGEVAENEPIEPDDETDGGD